MEPLKAIAVRSQQQPVQTAIVPRGTERSLVGAELEQFRHLCKQMQDYYPHQEFSDETVDGFLFDLERLAVIHGIDALRVALLNLRLRPGLPFFPHPTEVAEEIEKVAALGKDSIRARLEQEKRQKEIDEFWKTAAEWMQNTGHDEVELLKRFPSMRGTKPNTATGGA
jgi:hypothetical protein